MPNRALFAKHGKVLLYAYQAAQRQRFLNAQKGKCQSGQLTTFCPWAPLHIDKCMKHRPKYLLKVFSHAYLGASRRPWRLQQYEAQPLASSVGIPSSHYLIALVVLEAV